jgi:hypothetical protein
MPWKQKWLLKGSYWERAIMIHKSDFNKWHACLGAINFGSAPKAEQTEAEKALSSSFNFQQTNAQESQRNSLHPLAGVSVKNSINCYNNFISSGKLFKQQRPESNIQRKLKRKSRRFECQWWRTKWWIRIESGRRNSQKEDSNCVLAAAGISSFWNVRLKSNFRSLNLKPPSTLIVIWTVDNAAN